MIEPTFDLIFADPNQPLIEDLIREFEPYPKVGTHIGRFEDVPFGTIPKSRFSYEGSLSKRIQPT